MVDFHYELGPVNNKKHIAMMLCFQNTYWQNAKAAEELLQTPDLAAGAAV